MDFLRRSKEMQSFVGKVNFVRRFIPNFAEIVKDITRMLKKEVEIKWTIESKHSFEDIKRAPTQAPILISPDFSK